MRSLLGDREIRELGFVRASDGALLDNRDGFYDEHPDPIRSYDSRTMVAVSRSLLNKLLDDVYLADRSSPRREAA
jgi:hypothetical protein